MEQLLNFIDGELRPAASGAWLDVHAPATGHVYAQLPDSDERDVEGAVEASAQGIPRGTPWGVKDAARSY